MTGCGRRVRCWAVCLMAVIVVRCAGEDVRWMMAATVLYAGIWMDGGKRGIVPGEVMW